MFDSMPEPLKEQVLKFLEDDNFIAAKAIYDQWHHAQQISPENEATGFGARATQH